MYCCRFCGFHSENIKDFDEDTQNHLGFWCPDCDGFTFYTNIPENKNHSYFLLLENKSPEKTNFTDEFKIKLHSMVSPLRYPGGKSKLIKQILAKCNMNHMETFIEPFAGGASVGLSLLLSGLVKTLYLNDLDYGVYSLFEVIKTCPWALCERIKTFKPSKKQFNYSKEIIKNNYDNCDLLDAAWHLLIVNRLAFSGISKANCMSDPSSRWNANALIKKIQRINSVSSDIHVSNINAYQFIEEMYWQPYATMFLDPPYFGKGKDLYHCYLSSFEHKQLAFLLDELYKGYPGADMIITYDMSDFIKSIYDYPSIETINRNYCIAN